MSLLLREKLAISSIFPLQKGGSRTPSYSKYLLSNSIGVLGVSASLSAIVEDWPAVLGRRDEHTNKRTQTGQWMWDEAVFEKPLLRVLRGGRTSGPAANRAGEKWCNARSRVAASGPPMPRGCTRETTVGGCSHTDLHAAENPKIKNIQNALILITLIIYTYVMFSKQFSRQWHIKIPKYLYISSGTLSCHLTFLYLGRISIFIWLASLPIWITEINGQFNSLFCKHSFQDVHYSKHLFLNYIVFSNAALFYL